MYPSPPPTSSNLHSSKLRPPTEPPTPTPADWGNHCFSFYFQWIWLLYVLSMNAIAQSLSAVIGWHLAQAAEVLHVVCIRVSIRSGVPKLAFRLSALSAWDTALHLSALRLTCFFIVCTLHTLPIPHLPVGFGLLQIWTTANLSGMKMIVHMSFSDLVFKFLDKCPEAALFGHIVTVLLISPCNAI